MSQNSPQRVQAVFQAAIEAAPLGVFHSSSQSYTLIPASIQPLVLADSLWSALQRDAALILSALQKLAANLLQAGQAKREGLLGKLSPLEREKADFAGLATARLDLFFDGADLKVIEANTTIPAMQAYSDMIKEAYFKALHPDHEALASSNTQDLLHSLLQHYERSGGRRASPSIAIVARVGDSQLAELQWLKRCWQEQGYATRIIAPDDVSIKDRQLWSQGEPIDLSYRHIFAHRLTPGSAFAQACLESESYRVFNPIAAQLEAKAVLAELSCLATDAKASEAIGLHEDERDAVLRRLAWSRILQRGPTLTAGGEKIADLLQWVQQQPEAFVVKSSLGYGGRSVFLGAHFAEPAAQTRASQIIGCEGTVRWADFIEHLARREPGQWIVQSRISGRKQRHTFLAQGRWLEAESYVDCSIFCSSGIPFKPSGGACRFSADSIVNIGQGGGLLPLLLESEIPAPIPVRTS